jgi:two-component system sensor histidine kinase PilS (NtrC family)
LSPPDVDTTGALTPGLDDRDVVRRRLQWLMGARLLSASILLGGTMVVAVPADGSFGRFTPQLLLWLIVATFAASLGFAIWLPRAQSLRRLAAVQIATDLVVITGLVFVSGGVASVFTFLYGVAILMAALLIGPRASQRVAVVAVLGYTVMGVSIASGWLPHPPDQSPERYLLDLEDIGFSLVSNIVGLTLVAALAGNLSERLRAAGGELRRATESASRLARLNDDIVRSISSGLFTVDADGRVVSANPAAASIYRTTSDELVGRRVDELLPLEGESQRGEGDGTRPDGDHFVVGWNSAPLVDEAGRSTGTLYSFQDLSEIVELRDAARKAERLATLGGLSAGLAHEIRNPLGSISGSVELVREAEALSDEDRRLLSTVIAEVDRLEDLVTTMLSVGRPRPPNRARHDLSEIAASVVTMAEQGPASSRRIAIALEVPEAPVRAFVDGDQVRQVVWNLLKNALTATQPGGRVTITVVEAEDGGAEIRIRDEGAGIPEEARGRLFESFYSGRPHGVGLGLALVKQIIDQHDAEIRVESEPGKGSTFVVRFPPVNEDAG